MKDPWRKRIFALPHVPRDPKLVLHQTLDRVSRIKAVAVVIHWDDGSMDCDWSSQMLSGLCMASMTLDEKVRRVMGGLEPGVPEPSDLPPGA